MAIENVLLRMKKVNNMDKNFEQSMKELEQIAEKLSNGDISLDESIKLFEGGIKLSKSCQKILENAEKKVNILINKDGEIKKESFGETEG